MPAVTSTVASMTGFGRARGRLSDRLWAAIVIRSVNHRYLDVVVRTSLREELPEAEAAVRAAVARPLRRGRVTVQVNLEWSVAPAVTVLVDTQAVAALVGQLERLDLPGLGAEPVNLGDLLSVPGIVSSSPTETVLSDDELGELEQVAARATADFVAMRHSEGGRLVDQIRSELAALAGFLEWFEPRMPELRRAILDRVRDRITTVLGGDGPSDPERLLQEAAIQADKGDVGEEVVRMHSHLDAMTKRLDGGGAVGRELDFLCQEVHRELNTLGSKCREAGVTERLVDAKAAGERIREQVQNLE